MLNLTVKQRDKKTKDLKESGLIPAVLYGPKIKNVSISVNLKDFKKIYKEAGESSLVNLEVGDKKHSVLIYELELDPMTGDPIHVDFYQPILTEEVEATVPLVFEGESLAVKDLGGTLIKEIHELIVKALPQDLPHEIKVDISNLKTFENEILVKDLNIPEKVTIPHKDPEDIVALVTPPRDVEEELEEPIEENVEEVEEVGKEEKEEETVEEEPKKEENQ